MTLDPHGRSCSHFPNLTYDSQSQIAVSHENVCFVMFCCVTFHFVRFVFGYTFGKFQRFFKLLLNDLQLTFVHITTIVFHCSSNEV